MPLVTVSAGRHRKAGGSFFGPRFPGQFRYGLKSSFFRNPLSKDFCNLA
jgi:hypothetical protein